MIKNILVPVDFSDNSENALAFACGFSNKLNAKISLLHSYQVPIPVSDTLVLPISEKEVRKIALDGLNRMRKDAERKFPGTSINIQATLGMTDIEIPAFAKSCNAEIIIMGTHGASGIAEFLIGSNTANVMENAEVPVMAIPDKANFNGIKKMVFAADYGNHNFSHMHFLIQVAKQFDAEIILLHVSSGKIKDNFEDLEIGRFQERIIKESGYKNISYRMLEDKDVFHGVSTYIELFPPDLVVMSMHDRTLTQKIFSRSITKRMAYHSHVPVLALHIKNNAR